MIEDKKTRDKLAETDKNDDATTEDSNERSKQQEEKEASTSNVKKFLWWIVGNGVFQLIVGIQNFWKIHSMSIVGLLIFQLLFLFVLAEIYKLNFMKIFIDLMIKLKSKV